MLQEVFGLLLSDSAATLTVYRQFWQLRKFTAHVCLQNNVFVRIAILVGPNKPLIATVKRKVAWFN